VNNQQQTTKTTQTKQNYELAAGQERKGGARPVQPLGRLPVHSFGVFLCFLVLLVFPSVCCFLGVLSFGVFWFCWFCLVFGSFWFYRRNLFVESQRESLCGMTQRETFCGEHKGNPFVEPHTHTIRQNYERAAGQERKGGARPVQPLGRLPVHSFVFCCCCCCLCFFLVFFSFWVF
jgi:hypothetical protein